MNNDSQSFSKVLSIAQPILDQQSRNLGRPVTPEMIEQVLAMIGPLGFEIEDESREDVVDELIRRFSRTVGSSATLSNNENHIKWLDAERKKRWIYWQRYKEYIYRDLPASAVDALDRTTDEILGQLEDPKREGPWDRRGLVVGHVQSGKTGNYTGLICKAADAGYKIIIVLAGLHNNLRGQTQYRLDEGFLGYTVSLDSDELLSVGVSEIDNDVSIRPNTATNRRENGDFTTKIASGLNVSPEQRPWLFVVKKNKTVLERLLYWIRNRVVDGVESDSGRSVVNAYPVLVIDDESDNGSVDTETNGVDEDGQPDPEHSPTTINRLIREILQYFTRKSYVGYTATPFANIFIHDRGETRELGPDLFPAAFITNLAAPSNYIGPGRVFGSSSAVDPNRSLIRQLSEEEYADWIPTPHSASHEPRWKGKSQIPESLAEAIRAFVYACAIRILRGQASRHSSMLIHVSRFTAVQRTVTHQVNEYVKELRGRFGWNIGLEDAESYMRHEYEYIFRPNMAKAREDFPHESEAEDFGWDHVRELIPDILSDIEVREINGTIRDTLDYSSRQGPALRAIVIGGDKLARGLTLEGLTTSYFLRTSRMYDTLMQMGRWFGYRDGYLDTCRLYTTNEMVEWFTHIADAAEELRHEFDNMVAMGATPRAFGLRVKSHSVMTVTSRAKMRHARPMQLTYSGDLLQTIVFPNDTESLERNFNETERFLRGLGPSLELKHQRRNTGNQLWNGHLWREVSAMDVIVYLRSYRTHPASFRVMSNLIADFIEKMNMGGELTNWTVALVGKSDGATTTVANLPVTLIERQRSGDHSDRYSIKTLISPRDESIDLTDAQWVRALELSRNAWRNDAERNEGKEPPTEPRGPQIRLVLGEGDQERGIPHQRDRGLLLIYMIDPKSSGIDKLYPAKPVAAWAISLPTSKSDLCVSNETYVGNSVLWGTLNDRFLGEFE